MNRLAALVAVTTVVSVGCKKAQNETDAIDQTVIAQPPGPEPQIVGGPTPIGPLIVEAQRRARGMPFARIEVQYVGSDGVMDPAFATLEIEFSSGSGPADDPLRKTGAPAADRPRTKSARCPKVRWERGRWIQQMTSCSEDLTTMRCPIQMIWERAVAEGAPRDAVASLKIGPVPRSSSSPGRWRFDISDKTRGVSFHKTYPDDCGLVVEAPDPTVAQDLPVPANLDRTMIANGIGVVKARVAACGDGVTAKGQVRVSVKVTPDGTVDSVTVKATPDPALGVCVKDAVSSATFTKTQKGGTFSYPFVF